MAATLNETLALLARTPAALDALLRGLPESWTQRNEGNDTWTVPGVLAHLIYCERIDWLPRASLIRQGGAPQTFAALDREGGSHEGKGKSLEQLLDAFARIRAVNLDELRSWNLQPAELALCGLHPVFGSVTLSQLLATWATHDLTHLHQISRIMAFQQREAVGPWVRYLGVLHCNGHSE